ncbi:MAG: polysaccharide biosynthesis/export family protein [Elainella sp.]
MSRIANQVQPVIPAQPLRTFVSALALSSSALLAGTAVSRAEVPAPPIAAPAAPVAQQTLGTAPAAGSTGSQPVAPRRSVILTPATPNRTIVPPPTSAFPFEEAYTLGPGDQIELNIFDVPELSGATAGRYIVQLDGTINLNWAGVVRVQGLSLVQAEQVITQAYAPFVRNPLITASLVTTRSLRISVAGEIKRPGAYVISPEGATDNRILIDGAATGGGVANQWPTVTKAIQTAGGLTQFADLRRVQVRRPLADGSLELIDVNLWELLRTGELNQDIRLRDRDTLVIPTATTLNDSEALVIGAANFSPATIRVNVIGQVPTPGVVEVTPNTPLNQALMTAGGFLRPTARTSEVELVRLNSNGTASRRLIKVDLAAGINEATNPALRDYDTIIVSRNGATVFSENLNTVLEPVERFFGIFDSIFGVVDIVDGLGGD